MSESFKIPQVTGTAVPVRGNDIDTDRIIPARYLKCVTFDGLGEFAFYDVRYDENKNPTDHPFNDERFRGSSILLVNKNFGCGSSREHAPQALLRSGIKAIIGESFAEIFIGNCTTLGIPAVTASRDEIENLMQYIESHPDTEVSINLEKKSVSYDSTVLSVDLPEPSRLVLVGGTWDSTAQLIGNKEQIAETAETIPYLNW